MVSYVPFWLMSNRNFKLPKFQNLIEEKKNHAQNVIKINITNQNILQKNIKDGYICSRHAKENLHV